MKFLIKNYKIKLIDHIHIGRCHYYTNKYFSIKFEIQIQNYF